MTAIAQFFKSMGASGACMTRTRIAHRQQLGMQLARKVRLQQTTAMKST